MIDTTKHFTEYTQNIIHTPYEGEYGKMYVAGFLFHNYEVALIKKNKPAWQKGRLNGIGGKVELSETPYNAMVREFKEEAGAHISQWNLFCLLGGEDYTVMMFKSNEIAHIKTMEEEVIRWYNIHDDIYHDLILPNLKWLIPMAMDKNELISLVVDGSNNS